MHSSWIIAATCNDASPNKREKERGRERWLARPGDKLAFGPAGCTVGPTVIHRRVAILDPTLVRAAVAVRIAGMIEVTAPRLGAENNDKLAGVF